MRDVFDYWGDDPDLRRLAAEMTAELRAEAEEYERLAALDALRSRGLPEVALELLHRGDVVAVELARRSFVGTALYAAGDLLCLRTPTEDADIRMEAPLGLRVVERVRSGGLSRGVGSPSFKARLFEHEASGGEVVVGCRLSASGELTGRVHAVAVDHLVVEAVSGQRWYLSLRAVDYVAARRDHRAPLGAGRRGRLTWSQRWPRSFARR
ncbi:MAG: hypothetical protein ACRDZ4_16500 [Egibacteraceae bacterium]